MRQIAVLAFLLGSVSLASAADGAHFDAHKGFYLKALAVRQQVLTQEQACVQNATVDAGLRACRQAASASRQAMEAELRAEAQALKAAHH